MQIQKPAQRLITRRYSCTAEITTPLKILSSNLLKKHCMQIWSILSYMDTFQQVAVN